MTQIKNSKCYHYCYFYYYCYFIINISLLLFILLLLYYFIIIIVSFINYSNVFLIIFCICSFVCRTWGCGCKTNSSYL
jgi:hypothetical protein